MSDVNEAAPSEEASEAVQPDATPEAEAEQVEGQAPEGGQPPEADEADGEKTESQKRRERRKAAQARREAELAEARRKEAEARAKQERLQKDLESVKKPSRDDYEDPDDYIAANAAYMSQQGLTDREAKATQHEIDQAREMQQQALAQNWAEAVEDAKERYENFEQVAFSAPISNELVPLIAATPGGADLAYYLGSNHHEAARLSQLHAANPTAAAVEIGRLTATATAPQPKTKSKAPPPPETVGGSGARPGKDPSKMTMQEYSAWVEAGYPS